MIKDNGFMTENWIKVEIPVDKRLSSNSWQRLVWRSYNLKEDEWTARKSTYYFKNPEDAIAFKLKFGL